MNIISFLKSLNCKDYYLYHHLGLGDHIICNAWVRAVASKLISAKLFVKKRNVTSVAFMLRDCRNIELYPISDDVEVREILKNVRKSQIYSVGYFGKNWSVRHTEPFDSLMYKQGGLPFSARWKGFFVDREKELESRLFAMLNVSVGKYAFLHEDVSRGFSIDRTLVNSSLPIVTPNRDISDNIFDWCSIIEGASEIHCIDSSFRLLADSLAPTGKLFFHWYSRKADVFNTPQTKLAWKRID